MNYLLSNKLGKPIIISLLIGLFCFVNSYAQTRDKTDLRNIAQLLKNNPKLMQQLASAINAQQDEHVDGGADSQRTVVTNTSNSAIQSATPIAGQLGYNEQAQQGVTGEQTTANSASVGDYWSDYRGEQNNAAFKAVTKNAFPLSPEQIRQLHSMLDDTQRAVAEPARSAVPQPVSSSLIVNLAPGSTPPVIRLARGFVSSLVFLDMTGSPWPIQAYDLGNPSAFNIKWNKRDNTLMVQARSGYTYGNLAVILEKSDTPVMLTLVPGQKVVDYRVDLRIQNFGPNAKPDSLQGKGLPDHANPDLLSVLDGVPPRDAKRLVVEGGGAYAWQANKKLYVRTRFPVISPAWIAKMSSADGMYAYELPITPMILVSHYGKTVPVKITGL